MDEELNHILFEIDEWFLELIDCSYQIVYSIFDKYSGLELAKEEYLFKVNQLMAYTRALDHKLEERYNTILESRDNGDME
jgi:hypothetical protein